MHLTAVGDSLFFTANDGVTGRELWRSDGTLTGTSLVRDITGGFASSEFHELVAVAGTLFLTVGPNNDLWRSDGSETGTVPLQQRGENLTAVGRTLFYTSSTCDAPSIDAGCQSSVWAIRDGQALAEQLHMFTGAAVHDLTEMDGMMFFAADDDLWKSDGTPAGTVLVKAALPALQHVTNANGQLFFTSNINAAYSLWTSDGTERGTTVIQAGLPAIEQVASGADAAMFVTRDADQQYALWRSAGTISTTVQLTAMLTYIDQLVPTTTSMFFVGVDSDGTYLWKSDGTPSGTMRIMQLNEDAVGDEEADATGDIVPAGSNVFFATSDSAHGRELWKSDGTTAGTTIVQDILPGAESSFPSFMTATRSRLFLSAADGQGAELWSMPVAGGAQHIFLPLALR